MARKAFGLGISIERHITVLRETDTLLKLLFSMLLPHDPSLNKYWSIHLLQIERKVEIPTK